MLLASTALGWTAEAMIQATLPLLVLDLGGDAAMVGLVAASFAIPSLLLRPAIGRRIDRTGQGRLHQLGMAIGAAAALGYVVAPLVMIPVARLAQGVGWAMFGTSNNVVTARLAPPSRRGEASGLFNVAFAVAFLVGPPIGLFLYAGTWDRGPFLAASATCLVTLGAVTVLARLTPGPPTQRPAAGGGVPGGDAASHPAAAPDVAEARPRDPAGVHPVTAWPPARARVAGSRPGPPRPLAITSPGQAAGLARRGLAAYLEPAAVPMLAITATFMAGQALFVGFAPVYVRAIGAPVEWLAPYFPMYAVINVASQLVAGRVSDRIGRRAAVVVGATLGSIGLLVALLPLGFGGFAVGAACFAGAVGVVTTAATAATMDRAPAGRLGASMATFSMAYQLAAGGGGAVWGLVISSAGYPWPFALAIGLQLLTIALAVRHLPGRPGRELASDGHAPADGA